jgi:uncharacterized membrane protein
VQALLVAAIVGSGLTAGVLLAFSLAVMRSLSDGAPEAAMAAMQRINVRIVNPLFLLLFLGSAALGAAAAFVGWRDLPGAGGWCLLLGGAVYLAGPFGITMAFNVPLNERLAAADPAQAATLWPRYVAAWLRWNHVRSALGALATALLAAGLAAS